MIKNEDYEIYKEELLEKFYNILQLPKPTYLYKYLPLEGAVSSLEFINIQFSNPLTFNDITEGRNSRFIFIGKELRKVLLNTSLNKYEINKLIDTSNIDTMSDEKMKQPFLINLKKSHLVILVLLVLQRLKIVSFTGRIMLICIKVFVYAIILRIF